MRKNSKNPKKIRKKGHFDPILTPPPSKTPTLESKKIKKPPYFFRGIMVYINLTIVHKDSDYISKIISKYQSDSF